MVFQIRWVDIKNKGAVTKKELGKEESRQASKEGRRGQKR